MTSPILRSGGIIAACICLAACATGRVTSPRNLEQGLNGEIKDRVVVTTSKVTHVVHFATGSDEPDSEQISELNDFLERAGATRDREVLIERSGDPADDDRAAVIAGALAKKGLRPIVHVVNISAGELRLTMNRYTASAPGCPDWSKTPGNDFANTLPSDFGCATASDLAAMVADPRDLIEGRDMSPASSDAAVAGLQRYQSGKVSPLPAAGAGAASVPVAAPPPPAP